MPLYKIEKDACAIPFDMLFFRSSKMRERVPDNNLIYYLFLAFSLQLGCKYRLKLKPMDIKGG